MSVLLLTGGLQGMRPHLKLLHQRSANGFSADPSSVATGPGMLPPKVIAGGRVWGTVSYVFTVYFLPNFLSLLSIEILWAGYKMGRHRAVDGRP